MFGIGKKTSCSIDTVVGAQTRLEGDIHFSGGLHVDGVIKGNILAEAGSGSVLTVSESGRIEGDVHAGERVELASHARVTGNVFYNLIEMAMGAEVNGSLVHRNEPGRPTEVAEPVDLLTPSTVSAAK